MSQDLQAALPGCSYPIVFDRAAAWIGRLAASLDGRRALLVTDENVMRCHGETMKSLLAGAGRSDIAFHLLPPGEQHKTFAAVEAICRCAAQHGLDRAGVLIAFSGGVPGDLTGFAAAVYMRGIDFVQIPTTLLAAVDSSVGGKTGADLPEGKNLIGAFHQPRGVFIDSAFLGSLPESEWRNGMAEVVKYGMILDAEFLAALEGGLDAIRRRDPAFTGFMLRRSCECKASVVAEDEKEQGRRAILNYGHTVGHAVEKLSGFTIPHGAAVAVGMAAAARLAVRLGLCAPALEERQNRLLAALGLPTAIPAAMTPEAILAVMRSDKKSRNGAVTMILPVAPGAVAIRRDVADSDLLAVLAEVRK